MVTEIDKKFSWVSTVFGIIVVGGCLIWLIIGMVNIMHPDRECVKEIEGLSDMRCEEDSWTGEYFSYNRTTRDLADKRVYDLFAEDQKCYAAGTDVEITYDLFIDYNLTCAKIEYLNNHFIIGSAKKDGGSISGYTGGLFSRGSVNGKFYDWVQTESVAVGKLPKTISFHLNCKNETTYIAGWSQGYGYDYSPKKIKTADSKEIRYYSESDFVMAYTKNCIDLSLDGDYNG